MDQATSGQDQSIHAMHEGMRSAIHTALNCHDVCTQTIQHCLEHGGKHVEKQHMTLMMDCAQICVTSADFMLRNSQFHTQVCGACADVCEACAKSCEGINDPDGAMKACAEACRRCAQECRQMAGMRS
jgi:uncharacterized protein with beta-barrel porin domain